MVKLNVRNGGRKMVVYADVLIVVNLIVDYFLLKCSNLILKEKPKLWRIILGSGVGAVFSLYIFFPKSNLLLEAVIRLFMNTVVVLCCYGFKNFKLFLKSSGVFFGVTCLYAGIMIAIWQIFKPQGMVINNSVVYFNISPLVLTLTTVIGYFIFLIFSKVFASSSTLAQKCEITLYANKKSVCATAIIDTGNSISDVFSNSEIIIVDKSVTTALFGEIDFLKNDDLKARFRSVPCGTVLGADLLEGYRCDRAKVLCNGKTIVLKKPIAAISKTPLKENYSAILNPKTLDIKGEVNEKLFV